MIVVDPVMGDHGKLYPTMNTTMVDKMRSLTKKADIITPNFTEATYLLGEEYNKNITQERIKNILIKLSDLGPKIVIITSVPNTTIPDNMDVFAYDRENNEFWKASFKHIPVDFPGTGDIFASVLIGGLLNNFTLSMAIDKSIQFLSAEIEDSCNYSYEKKEGILLEKMLDELNTPIVDRKCELLDS